jgi:hypothetical protein
VFRALVEAFPEKRYKPNLTYQPRLECHWDFFPVRVREGIYLSEDFAFCEDALAAGFPTFILPECKDVSCGFHGLPIGFEQSYSSRSRSRTRPIANTGGAVRAGEIKVSAGMEAA